VYEHINNEDEDDDEYSDYFDDIGDTDTDKNSSVKKKKK